MTKPANKEEPTPIKIPLVEEQINYRTEQEEVGKVRVTKRVQQEAVELDEPVTTETAEVERIPINQFVEELPTVRQEANLTVIPVVEEVMVKRLRLVEEIHIRKTQETKNNKREVSLRKETVDIQREPDTKQ